MPNDRDGNLFPSIDFPNGWRISAQADSSGYQCSPRERLDTLHSYESVEVVIYGPNGAAVDGYVAGLPAHIAKKFSLTDTPHMGAYVTLDELRTIQDIVSKHPAAIPHGGDITGYDHCKHHLVRSGSMVVISFFGLTHTILAIDHVRSLREFFAMWEEHQVPDFVQMCPVGAAGLFAPVRKQGSIVIMRTPEGHEVNVPINDVRAVIAAAFASFSNPDGTKFSIGTEGRPA